MFESVEGVQARFRDARYIAILSEEPVVLLVDEIDKAEPEFEAFLLEVLSDFQVSVPELGTVMAKHIPLVVLTSNNARELSDGLKRRCLHLFIDFPSPAEELEIIRLKVPEVPEKLARAVVAAVQKIRAMDLRKLPSVSESLDWARSLVILNARELSPELVESTLTMLVKHEKDLERMLAEEGMELDDLTELLMRGGGSELEMAIRASGQNAGLERLMYFLQVGFFSRRISDRFDWSTIEADLEKIMEMLEARGLDPGQLARIRNYLELRLEAFKRMIRQHVERELERRAYRQGEKLTREVLSDKPLFALTPDEIAQMKSVVARLARKIKDALALRQRQEQRGRLDTRRTMRKSLQYDGVPMEVVLRRRHREKPKLVTICDVSDSVRNASRFMLQLVWSLQECFSRVRSYAFVSEIAEVTQAFSIYPVERAIEWALKAAPVDYHCRSDFGYAFNRFAKTELDSLDRKTTILILGDARNNYNDPH